MFHEGKFMGNRYIDKVFYKSASNMAELPDNSVQVIITSPPYFNIKDYSKDGHQDDKHSKKKKQDMGAYKSFDDYINGLVLVWKECERVLKPNGKLCINVPLVPMLKSQMQTHYNRDIFDLQSHIQQSILRNTKLYLMDLYIWNRTNSSKKLMFGSYPYPRNFYAQNSCEFITVFVKDGKPENGVSQNIKDESQLTQEEWVEFTKQIWNIPIPGKGDIAFGIHSAIMPEEIVRRLVRLYSFVGELILDPFTGSGTTLKVAKEHNRHYVGYEIYDHYKDVIEQKLGGKK
jgi:site-specific DNA-methyltransferase (cytosine-N4-specific)